MSPSTKPDRCVVSSAAPSCSVIATARPTSSPPGVFAMTSSRRVPAAS
jgi:hypothetical protein